MIPTVVVGMCVAVALAWWLTSAASWTPSTQVRPVEQGAASKRLRERQPPTAPAEVHQAPVRILRPDLIPDPVDDDTDF